MSNKIDTSRVLLALLVATGSLILFALAVELFDNSEIEALSGVFSIVLSGLLVLLYRQQKDVLERQERIMEAEYVPMLSYGECGFIAGEVQMTFGCSDDVAHESAAFDAYNYGSGRAVKIRTEILIGNTISFDEDIESITQKVKTIVEQKSSPRPVRRKYEDLEDPFNSLEAKESASFIGHAYFRFAPTDEIDGSFQTFTSPDLEPGEPVTATIVVEYQDILGNSYRDIPFVYMFQYVPNTALQDFPAASERVPRPQERILRNIEYGDDSFGRK